MFADEPVGGLWKLAVTDTVRDGVTGVLDNWTLIVTPQASGMAASSLLSGSATSTTSSSPISTGIADSSAATVSTDTANVAVAEPWVAAQPAQPAAPGRLKAHAAAVDAAVADESLEALDQPLLDDLAAVI